MARSSDEALARRAPGTWVVTGAASGFGRELARRLVASGADVALWDRDAAGLEATREALVAPHGGSHRNGAPRVHIDAVDVADIDGVGAAAERARALGPVAHVVCSAGILRVGSFEEVPAVEYRRMMEVNYLGSVHVAHTFLRDLRAHGTPRRRSTLLFVASVAGLRGFPELAGYSASKFAVVGLAQALEDELCTSPVDVRVLCPPPGDTPMVRNLDRLPPVYRLSRLHSAEAVVDAAFRALAAPRSRRSSRVMLVDAGSRVLDRLNRSAPSLLDIVVRTAARRDR